MGEATKDSPVPLDRIMHGHWVGRVHEMAEANALWQRVVQGEGQVLLISGEPGVGKTRFVRELASALHLGEDSVLTGECYAEGGAPYAPLAQMIRTIFEGSPQAVKDIQGEALRNLLAIFPTPSLQLINLIPDQNVDLRADQQ
jgi:predicted ATPase